MAQMPRMEPAEVVELSKTALCGCCKLCGEPEEESKRFLICGHSLCIYKYYHIRASEGKGEGVESAHEQRMLKLHRKDDGAILKSAKYYGVDMLLDAAEMLSKDEQMVIPQKGVILQQMPRMEPAEVVEAFEDCSLWFVASYVENQKEESKRFLICGHSLCIYKYYHIRCLTPKQIASDAQRGKTTLVLPIVPLSASSYFCSRGGEWYCPSCSAAKAKEKELRAHEQRMLKLHRKDDGAILRSAKYYGVDMLLDAAEMLSKDEQMVIPQK
ncbi:hypothetical protein PR202_ga08831 [Eleusine coracana subsp. coracana]|uniref:Uncharacterized protein n=1 Tax=Eleusine coracana subsp. coracana TaxID=191504 RepID=A0AAV5C3L3_ELECO|nr:hypothetical protein PR202_ga08831 [Eleusine coracana subsp. coracana]